MKRFVLLILAIGSPVSAQDTTCVRNGNQTDCTTRRPPNTAPTDFISGLGGVQNLPGNTQPQIAPQVHPATAEPSNGGEPPPQMRASWAQLADLIKDHRCSEAIDLAIREGGTEAGLRTKALCQ